MEQVHRSGSGGQFLLPDRDLVVLRRRRNDGDQRLPLPGEQVRLLEVNATGVGFFLSQSRPEKRREAIALILAEGPGPTISRGRPERRDLSSDKAEERSLSIGPFI
jgi:hypothetical protein